VRSVLAEGGPSLNGQLVAAGLLDELCLTLSPMLVGGDAKRILSGTSPDVPRPMGLCSLCEQDGFLFLRLRPAQPIRPPQPSALAGTAVAAGL
jgi:5-amino-6-(5-phosphoribosylamino)uracil reductase